MHFWESQFRIERTQVTSEDKNHYKVFTNYGSNSRLQIKCQQGKIRERDVLCLCRKTKTSIWNTEINGPKEKKKKKEDTKTKNSV